MFLVTKNSGMDVDHVKSTCSNVLHFKFIFSANV